MKPDSIRRFIGAGVAVLALLAGCTASPATSEPTMEASSRPGSPTLRVGISRTAPPVIFQQDGETVGLEADFARELAATLGMELWLASMYWPNLIPELRAGRIDIVMAGMSITDERRREVAFTEPYLTTGQAALIRAADQPSLGTARQLLGTRKSIGVEGDSTGEAFVEESIPSADRKSFVTASDAVEALVLGDVDIVIHDQLTILWLAREHAGEDLFVVPGRLTNESLAWAVRRDNLALRQEINAILASWKESGQLDEMIARWVPAPLVDTK